MLDKKIGYIKLDTFDLGCADDIRNKCQKLISEGAKGIILDLRNNYGGVMDHARLLRVEIDENEFNRAIQNTVNYHCDLKELLSQSIEKNSDSGTHSDWLKVCGILKEELKKEEAAV